MFLWQGTPVTYPTSAPVPAFAVSHANLLANTPVPLRRRFRVRGTWLCKYANALPSRCWQPQTARRQNCPTFLQNNFVLSRGDLTEWLSEEQPVYWKHLLPFYWFARGRGEKNTQKWFIFASSSRLSRTTRWARSDEILSVLKMEK